MRQCALITGAAGGLGRAFAWELAARGWDLLLTDTSEDALRLVAHGVARAHGVRVRVHVCNLQHDRQVRSLATWAGSMTVPVDVLVNIAGFDVEGVFLERAPERLLALMRVNMEAGMLLTHELVSRHAHWEPIRVINTASLAAFYPMPYKALYAASKAFVLSSSLALRHELHGRATVTVLCPAGMPTTPGCREAIRAQGLVGRLTTMNTSDVARRACSAAMRGTPLVVPGLLNRLMLALSRVMPLPVLSSMIGARWAASRRSTVRRAS